MLAQGRTRYTHPCVGSNTSSVLLNSHDAQLSTDFNAMTTEEFSNPLRRETLWNDLSEIWQHACSALHNVDCHFATPTFNYFSAILTVEEGFS